MTSNGPYRCRPQTGDLIKIELTGVDDLAGGKTAKRHQVKIARGQAKHQPPASSRFVVVQPDSTKTTTRPFDDGPVNVKCMSCQAPPGQPCRWNNPDTTYAQSCGAPSSST